MQKVKEAKLILKEIGMPLEQQTDLVALTLLALSGITKKDDWSSANNIFLRIHDIIQFVNDNYDRAYAENSRETFRKKALHHFRNNAIVEDNGCATNSPRFSYKITNEMLQLIRSFNTRNWKKELDLFRSAHESLISLYASKKKMQQIPVIINGCKLSFSKGSHNLLQKAIIEEFGPRFAPSSEVIYVGDTTNKAMILNQEVFEKLGFGIVVHDKMPDVILYSHENDWLYFIEAVTSVGPISPKRKLEIEKMTENVKSGIVYVTAFLNFKTYKSFANKLAWETEVWIKEMPEHMIHLNGDRFMGPR
ncbi:MULTISPECIES: BsuBI/PstI family type II restriction endonuclease [unclassified Breznakia]|uniref:BsuBI/PstI family type II restriction endonuclease n=1 Tax=unclassified Breznakia TaxID=2623764 RepID=UPI002472FFDD|nr:MULTISPECIES: BsuBI/PstI family type II restriction endonuclease [unclassified Breznakia]MDH6367406.1 hypothetical protein [Breznakia sp. PH1-1]MDH6403938.1 hypothetical protein [Breznakia sp. PF1-11]MDH6411647.1 hypothetical protein [Breznakia sp. PFB1-11]MDH6414573.1 hypothetical protein [Breznakia sp. PFB1-14]MDH6418679.1 hypothetical protein [Breznakia sp. PFB1-12]